MPAPAPPSAGQNPLPSVPQTSSVSMSSSTSSKTFTKPRPTTNPANSTKSPRSSKRCSSATCSVTKPARGSTKRQKAPGTKKSSSSTPTHSHTVLAYKQNPPLSNPAKLSTTRANASSRS